MNNTCGCPFADMSISDLEGLERDNLVVQCVEWINALSKNISNEELIIEIASHLPASKECAEIIGLENKTDKIKESFNKAFSSVRFVIDHIINNGLYYKPEETIKFVSIAISRHTIDEDYWKEKLLNNLMADPKMKSMKIWTINRNNIRYIVDTFGFSQEGFDKLLKESLNDGFLNHMQNWFEYGDKIIDLIELFNFPEEDIELSLEKALNNGFLDDISNWSTNKSEIMGLIQLFSLPKETVFKHLEDIIQERVSLLSGIDKMSDDEIIEVTENIKNDFLSTCLGTEETFEILTREKKGLYRKLADQLMIKANKSHNKEVRARLTDIAAHAYSYISDRKRIEWLNRSDNVNKTIRVASKIIGYNYKNQGIKDTWPLRYFY